MAKRAKKTVNDYTRQLGSNIRRVRFSKGIDLPTVAQALAKPVGVLEKIEAGIYPTVTIAMLLQLADYYEVSIADFFQEIHLGRS